LLLLFSLEGLTFSAVLRLPWLLLRVDGAVEESFFLQNTYREASTTFIDQRSRMPDRRQLVRASSTR
jgi:hypothetical protein